MIQLASNSEDLLTYLPLNRGFDPTLLAADIDDALRDYILPYLSRAQFDVSFASVDAKHVELISIVKKSAFNLALGSWLRLGKVYISESGIQYGVEKDKQASSEDKADAIASAKQKGLKAIDQLLLFLEQNADNFSEWKQSSSYTVYTASFVRNANEFGIINNSRSVFLQLKTFIQDVERMYIEDLLPIATITTLLSRDFSLLTAENKAIYERLLHNYIIPFVRDMSMSKAARSMAVIKDQ